MFANMSQERIEFNNLKSNIKYLQKQQVLRYCRGKRKDFICCIATINTQYTNFEGKLQRQPVNDKYFEGMCLYISLFISSVWIKKYCDVNVMIVSVTCFV